MVELSSEKIIELVIWSTIGVALLVFFLVWALFQHYRVLIKKKHELVTTIIETQETERFRIAQDLHDNFGNFLNIIHLEISTLEQIKNIERMQTTFGFLLQNVDLARKELTGNILDLAPNSLKPIDWIEEVRRIFHILNKEKKNFVLTVEGQIVEYSQVNQTNLFRICQELINNTLKYSQATEVKVVIKFHSNFVEFQYFDNGVGFDLSSKTMNGFGLKSIQARTDAMKGKSVCKSNVSEGTNWHFHFSHSHLIDK